MSSPFSRARAVMALVAAAMGIVNVAERQSQLASINPYKSRGKGRGTPSRRFGNRTGRSYPHHSARECVRRQRKRFDEHPMAVKLAHERRDP